MPRENRKRGKKHKKQRPEEDFARAERSEIEEEARQRPYPSWIVERGENDVEEGGSLDAPFGYVDPDVKAYFKTVDDKLREWQEINDKAMLDEGREADPNEERRMFLVAALKELSGNERQLATDPECSNVLERMAYSMDDFVKRVFVDRLAGSYETLSKHRFGSHVVQTLLSVAKGTICREAKGMFPPSLDAEDDMEKGRLPPLTELVINISNELLPLTTNLIMDPFASHVLRALFVLLCPKLPSAASSSILRSKKSAKHRSKQGPMKSVLENIAGQDGTIDGKGKGRAAPIYPAEFESMAGRFAEVVRNELTANEVRALATNKAACPVLILLLEIESLQGTSNESGSLMDSVSAGLITSIQQNPDSKPEASDYVTTLLRDASSSHLLEKVIALAPDRAFSVIWDLYFSGKLSRLAVHPVANFVVARGIEHASAQQLSAVLEELQGAWTKLIKNARTGVLKALIDRAVQLKSHQEDAAQVVLDAFDLHGPAVQDSLVECVLHLKTFNELQEASKGKKMANGEDNTISGSSPEPTVQGSILLQSLLRLDALHNQLITQSLTRLPISGLLAIAHHPTSSRILDALLDSPTVPSKARRELILAFQGHFPALVADRIGSRVGERLWAAADPYLKEKIARGLIPHENVLVGSRYGKFFVRGLKLYLLKRDPEKWKAQQSRSANDSLEAKPEMEEVEPIAVQVSKPKSEPVAKENREEKRQKRKRKDEPRDEIDALFESTLGKRQKKGSLSDESPDHWQAVAPHPTNKSKEKDLSSDKELSSIFTAIRDAPRQVEPGGKKKKKN